MLRYRIHHDRGHRDGLDDMIAPIIVHGSAWSCECCGFHDNEEGEDRFCGWCSAPQGDWLCDCGRRNRRADEECSECGREKPEGD